MSAQRFGHLRRGRLARIACCAATSALWSMALLSIALSAEDEPAITLSRRTGEGILVHGVRSAYQRGATEIRVLLPEKFDAIRRVPVVYLLPVEPQGEHRYGAGLTEVLRHDLANKHGVIFVEPTFAQLPWYADHPSDPELRQETYLLQVVLPLVERIYPALAEPRGRLLLGFSKSGWGAWSLLLRHPDRFGRAVAWDAPLLLAEPGKYGSGPIFGTADNFERYRLTTALERQAEKLRAGKRLLLLGYGGFRAEHQQMHQLLDALRIPHDYRDGPQRQHDWHSGWVAEAVALLLEPPAPAK